MNQRASPPPASSHGPSAVSSTATTPAKDSMGLVEFPIAIITTRALPDDETTVTFADRYFDRETGQHRHRSVKIIAPRRPARADPQQPTPTKSDPDDDEDIYGLPTPTDDEVILACLQLTKHRGFEQVLKANGVVRFSLAEGLRILRWTDTGPNRARFRRSLLRWKLVTFTYKNSWWDNHKRKWTNTKSFSLINDLDLNEVRSDDPTQATFDFAKTKFRWPDVMLQSFKDGSLRDLNLDRYFRLQGPLSRRMFRLLDKEFHNAAQKTYDLKIFFYDRIGLRRQYHTGELKRIAAKAIRELEEEGFINPDEHRFHKQKRGQWSIRFARGPRYKVQDSQLGYHSTANESSAALPPPATTHAPATDPAAAGIVKELIARGVTPSTAAELAVAHPADKIAYHLDVFDWMLERKDKRLSENPPGYLVKSIREDYAAPKGFTSKAERQRLRKEAEETTRRKQEAQERKQQQEATEKQRKAEHLARIHASLTDAERQEFERLARIDAGGLFAKYFHQNDPHSLEMRRTLIDQQILKKFPLPTP